VLGEGLASELEKLLVVGPCLVWERLEWSGQLISGHFKPGTFESVEGGPTRPDT
jgi:hypothetical protein